MKTLTIRFVDGPLHGQSREIAIPPVQFVTGPVLDANDHPVGWPNVPDEIGHYEQDSYSQQFSFAVFVWVPFIDCPDCLKPLDAIEYAAHSGTDEKRRFAYAGSDGSWGFTTLTED